MGIPATDKREYHELASERQTVRELLDNLDDVDAMAQLRRLSEDPDWEVRHEVALAMAKQPDDELAWFADRLINDSNAYVQRAARRTLHDRRRQVRAESHRQQNHARVARRVQGLESRTGQQVGRICREHSEELMAQVAHDLRAIATRLKPACYELANGGQRAADIVLAQLSMFDKLIEDLQLFSEPLRAEKQNERLAAVVQAAIEAAQTGVAKLGIETAPVRIVADMNAGIVVAIACHLVQIALTNVIQNSLESFITNDAMQTGEIRIDAGVDRGVATIRVADNGPGMTDDELTVVAAFLPGRRNLDKPFSTGFGLPIAARNIAAHDGHLELASCKGVGTRVTITLPV